MKRLFMLEIDNRKSLTLVPFYAEDEETARDQARAWAEVNNVKIPDPPTIRPFPHGFKGNYTWLPGTISPTSYGDGSEETITGGNK